jgi:hypothetical protein
VLGRHAAVILSRNRPDPDKNLTMRFRGGNAEVAVRLVGKMRQNARGYVYGVAKHFPGGGPSFRSRKSYAVGSLFEVAVPYSPESLAIFVPASIRHVEALNVGSLFGYGAACARKGFVDSPPRRLEQRSDPFHIVHLGMALPGASSFCVWYSFPAYA